MITSDLSSRYRIMQQIDLDKAKTQMTRLLESALGGEEVIITENDQPVLKIVRVSDTDTPIALHRRDKSVASRAGRAGALRAQFICRMISTSRSKISPSTCNEAVARHAYVPLVH